MYGEEVLRIEPELREGKVDHLRIVSRDPQGRETQRRARSVVVGSAARRRSPTPSAPSGTTRGYSTTPST